MSLIAWIVFIFVLSSQPYEIQNIVKPFLYKHASEQQISKKLPDITLKYRSSVIHAKQRPFEFIDFVFRKSAHLFVYAMLAFLAAWNLAVWKKESSHYSARRARGIRIVGVLVFIGFVASLDEWNQLHAAQRTGAIEDIGIDLFGGLIGVLLLEGMIMVRKRWLNKIG